MIFPNEQSSFDEKYQIPPLSEYLLLTCFDQLGQPNEWMAFDNWIKSKKKAKEREQVLSNIQSNDKIQVAHDLFKGYQELYSVKNSFFRFFSHYLIEPHYSHFFNQLRIEEYLNYPDNLRTTLADSKTKKRYLFGIRNNFTHSIKSTGPYILLFSHHKDKDGWYEKQMVYGKPITQRISVTDNYYLELENAVKAGMWQLLQKYVKEIEEK
jgi:hypothetical protein